MILITHKNIEELMFDYFEGNLSTFEMAELEAFIAQNPVYQSDFNAWKESYAVEDTIEYPYADQLIAGSGGTWLRWIAIALLLVGSGYAAWWISFTPINLESTENSVSLSANKHQPKSLLNFKTAVENQTKKHQETQQIEDSSNLDEIVFNANDNGIKAKTSLNQNGIKSPIKNILQSRNSKKHLNRNNLFQINNDSKKNNQYTPTYKNKINHQIKQRSYVSLLGQNHGTSIDTVLTASISNDTYASLKFFKFSNTHNSVANSENTALAQAIGFFTDQDKYNTSEHKYTDKFPQINSNFNENKHKAHHHRSSGLSKILKRLSDGMRFSQNLGLRNVKDPYILAPEFYHPMQHNGGFTGTFNSLRIKTAYRSVNGRHTGSFGFDTRVGRDFGIGIGAFGKYTNLSKDGFTMQQSDILVNVSPQLNLSKTVTLAPSVGFKHTQFNTKFNGVNRAQAELANGVVYSSINRAENDTLDQSIVTVGAYTLNTGVLLNTDKFYLGLSVDNLFNSRLRSPYIQVDGDIGFQRSFTAIIGTDYKYSYASNNSISPSLLFKQTGNRTDIWTGVYFRLNKFIFGGSYGNHKEAMGMIGIQTRALRFGITGDYTKSLLIDKRYQWSIGTTLRLYIGSNRGTTDLPKT